MAGVRPAGRRGPAAEPGARPVHHRPGQVPRRRQLPCTRSARATAAPSGHPSPSAPMTPGITSPGCAWTPTATWQPAPLPTTVAWPAQGNARPVDRPATLLRASSTASPGGQPCWTSTKASASSCRPSAYPNERGSTRRQGHLGWFAGLRLRCGNCRAAAGGCHRASLMIKRSEAAAAVRPGPAAPFRLTALAVSAGHTSGCAAGWHCRLSWAARCRPGRPFRVSLGW